MKRIAVAAFALWSGAMFGAGWAWRGDRAEGREATQRAVGAVAVADQVNQARAVEHRQADNLATIGAKHEEDRAAAATVPAAVVAGVRDPTASAWSYYTPPAGVNIRSRYGAASLPNGEIWTVGLDTSTSTEGYVISRDGGLTFERPIIPDSLPGVTAGYNRPGMIAYDETLRLLVIEPFLSGPGVGSARQFISRDNGATFQPTDIPAPLNGTNMARPEGVQWSPSAGCIIGSDSDTNPTIYFSRTGMFK